MAFAAALGLAAALVILRSVVWVFYEESFFDSDQAVMGLMAKHLAEGRAFPLFFYGQHYMLGVEAFLAAPLFRIAGPSVVTLKLPLLALNLVTAGFLIWLAVRELSVRPVTAFLISLFFVVPPPLISLRFVEAQGSNIEPLLYILILWVLRSQPVALGAFAAFAFFHREFAAYGIAALILVDVVAGRATRERLREYALSWGVFCVVAFLISLLKTKADLLGPGSAGVVSSNLSAQIGSWGQFVCWPPTELSSNLRWLFSDNLGTVFNWKRNMVGPQDWRPVPSGWPWLAPALFLGLLVAGFQLLRFRTRLRAQWQFGAYLMLVGLASAFFYAVLGCHVRDVSLVRYTLLTLYFPIGLLMLFAVVRPPIRSRAVVFGVVILWAAMSLFDDSRLLVAFIHRPPPSHARALVTYLEGEGVKYARGPYWVAYELDFLSNERLIVSSVDKVRIAAYQDIVNAHDAQTVHILPNGNWPAKPCDGAVTFRIWCLQYFERARNVSRPGRSN
jgi:hypothetical protein